MNLILLFFFILAILIVLLFSVALKIRFVFDTNKSDMNMTILWLKPLLKAYIFIENTKPILTLYLFNKKILRKTLIKKNHKTSSTDMVKLAKPKDIHVNTQFGFKDPFITGIACGAVNFTSQFINIDDFNQSPDFMATNDYIYMDANAKINLGSTFVNYIKARVSK